MVNDKDYDKKSYHAGFQDGYAEAKEMFKRPKGKWIPSFQNIEYKCSICGRVVTRGAWEDVAKEFPYCHCGANMRGGENG